MTPIFLKSSSPFSHDHLGDQIRDHQQQHLKLFISPYNEGSSSLVSPSPTFFDSNSHQYQSAGVGQTHDQQRDQNDVIDVVSASQKASTNYQDTIIIDGNYNMNNNNTSGGGSVKYWMSSKMRLIQKMTNPETPAETVTTSLSSSIGQQKREKSSHKIANSPKQDKSQITFSFSHTNTPGGGLRVCSDCNTTTTPLWRSGPRGPKSLCNACGIRQRKARRAMAEAAAGGRDSEANGSDITANNNGGSMKSIYNYKTHVTKEKKARVNHGNIAHYKSKLKLKIVDTAATTKDNKSQTHSNKNDMNDNKKFCFGDFSFGLNDKNCSAFSGVFPQDVAEAAMLLMELSCHGLVHS